MKVTILQEKLKEGLMNVEKVTGKESTLPILNNVLMKTDKNFLDLVATNLETGILWKILSKTEQEGVAVLPAGVFSGFIGSLPGKSIEIDSDNSQITVLSEKHKSVFKGFNAEDFPTLPFNTEGESVEVKAGAFCEMLSQVANFASISTIKPEIAGVYLVFKKDLIKAVATDGFRLGEKTIYLAKKQELSKDYSLILPQRAVKEIVGVFSGHDKNIKIYFSPNQITVESVSGDMDFPQIQYVSRLIEGEFPNYEEIIPKAYKTTAVFPRKEFLGNVKSASLFSGKINEINLRISIEESKAEIFSQTTELGECQSEIKLSKAEGNDLKISFNYKFLIDGLSAIKSDNCAFDFSGEDSAGVLKPEGDGTFIYILMPIKKN
ncbi:MAG TPA: DNA polymerase III subunit beta [Candidatus Paceibacterota bacterium]|nr:DNA polymerase III subunit beta [Candidatus Pacearchaeota archaeon]HRZ51190.1 DNA polymerase III subunit beta [Candidatus Paceibacterota bacterium]HSA36912.1 DNA polymerase III subunit beta [Candidatus Paceibacterota bacterium]